MIISLRPGMRQILWVLLAIVLVALVPKISWAAERQTVTQAYGSDGSLRQGMIVRIDEANNKNVVALEAHKLAALHGVVIPANEAPLSLSGEGYPNTVYVATYGRHEVLVSDQNGVIKIGDYISASALDGIGTKATKQQTLVVGKAAQDFNGTQNVVGSTSLKNGDGKTIQVSLGRIAVDMSIGHNPLYSEQGSSGGVGFLKSFTGDIAGKPVSGARLYIALAIIFVSSIVAGSMLYSGIRSAISAIGRNPLAKSSILKSLLQVVLTSIIIFAIGLFGVYLLLKF